MRPFFPGGGLKPVKKRLLSLLTAAALLIGTLPFAFAGYENFSAGAAYTEGQFTDVSSTAWYAQNVKTAYEYGLINGVSATKFEPDRNLTLAETIKLAACIHSVYMLGSSSFAASSPWYQTYVDYALANGIISGTFSNYSAAATRGEFVEIMAAALPKSAFTQINTVEDNAIPDVSASASYADAAYLLYRAGVLTGDTSGRLNPSSRIRRSEAAAIVTRMADPTLRLSVTLESLTELTQDEIMQTCMPAVFKLYAYDADGEMLSVGSGVIISASGEAVSCGHVVNGVSSLRARLLDGTEYDVSIYAMDAEKDISHLQLNGTGLPYLKTGGTVSVKDRVYALGYPGGGPAQATRGQVIDPENTDYNIPMIKSSTRVVSGNSGGALVDKYGRLVGITVSSTTTGSPSFAVPIAVLKTLSGTTAVSPAAYTAAHLPDASACYAEQYPVPDFGTVEGVPLYGKTHDSVRGKTFYYYRVSDMTNASDLIDDYYVQLNKNTFYLFSGETFSSSAGYGCTVQLFETQYRGADVLAVVVSEGQAASAAADALSLPGGYGLYARGAA